MNELALRQLSYVSTATRVLDGTDLEDLVVKARAKNSALGVTGLLLYNGLNFMQTLEGDGPVLETLLQSIAGDERHTGIVVVADEPVSDRTFAGWNLRCARTHASPEEIGNCLVETGWPTGIPPQLRKLYDAFTSVAGV